MRFLIHVGGYIHHDRRRNAHVQQELKIMSILDAQYLQKWFEHLKRMGVCCIPKEQLNNKPKRGEMWNV